MMQKILKRSACVLSLIFIILLQGSFTALAVTSAEVEAALNDTAEYIYNTVKNPQVGSIGGEWAIIGLARSGYEVPEEYYQDYYATVEEYVKACNGVLHKKKYTEYSRVILALTAIGKDPANVAGYNLLTALGDYDKTIWQGLNGPIWALIALDSGSYDMPQNSEATTQATRDMYVDRILECQLPDGGFSLFGGTAAATEGDMVADPDITGMALQALVKYQYRDDVKKVTEEALECLSKMQKSTGGYASWGTTNSESVVQVIVALTELGISLDDPRFVKNGYTLLDNLMTFYIPGQGFLHTANGSGSNQMATEQAFYGLVAAWRASEGKNSLYRMDDALHISASENNRPETGKGLEGKHPDITSIPIIYPGKTFPDISAHVNQPAIEALASRGVINGKSDMSFDPDATMTRAEFAAIVVRGLGLSESMIGVFSDVTADSWYAGYVGAAYSYGIVNGKSESIFDPAGTITREEAATMIARAAELAGMDTDMNDGAVRDMLAQFIDYVTASDWARRSLAFCYREGILSQQDLNIRPKDAIKRCEVAGMLFNMLGAANLI